MSWRKTILGELIDNFSVRAKDVGGADGLDFFGVSNEEGIIKTKYAAEEKAEDYKIIEKDCFAYNPYRVNVGSIGMVADDVRGLISPAYVVFKPKPNSIIPELLFKFLKSSEGLRQIKFYARGTVRQALRFDDLCKIQISIPDYKEQKLLFKRIIDSEKEGVVLISEFTNQLNILKQLRQSFLREAMQGRLVPQYPKEGNASDLLKKIKEEKEKLIAEGKLKKEKLLPPIKPEEIPYEIPENWVWCRLGLISASANNGLYKPESFYKDSGSISLRMFNIQKGRINTDKVKRVVLNSKELSNYLLEKDDILVNRVNSRELVGKAAIIVDVGEPIVFESMNIRLRLFYKSKMAPFCNFVLLNERARDYFYSIAKIANGQVSINQTQLFEFPIPLPPLMEQQRIVKKLDELLCYCDELEQSILMSREQNEKLLQLVLRDLLMHKTVK